jgi:hypothetical protein
VWKLAGRPDDPSDLKDSIVGFLARHHFDVVVTNESLNRMPMIRATAGSCSMIVVRSSAYGWSQDMIRSMAGQDRVFVVFAGRVYAEQPVLMTLLAQLWSKFLREIRVVRDVAPVIAVIAPPQCEAERLPWNELGEVGTL